MSHRFRLFAILLCLAVAACGTDKLSTSTGENSSEAIIVSAAVSLKDGFNEIAGVYKTKTGRTINFNFGASGALQKQIETGAPVDVFASAGEKQMDDLAAQNLIDAATRKDFARNSLVLIVPADSKLRVSKFDDLSSDAIKKIAVGNPKTVPAGQYTQQTFDRLNLNTALQPKLVPAEDVRQVLDYVLRGEADAGIAYATDARIAIDKVRVVASAPEDSHDPILYPLAVIAGSRNKKAAQEFIDLVMSAEGQNILNKYGFQAGSNAAE